MMLLNFCLIFAANETRGNLLQSEKKFVEIAFEIESLMRLQNHHFFVFLRNLHKSDFLAVYAKFA